MSHDTALQGKMTLLLGQTAKALRSFVEQAIPTDKENWWELFVINALSFQQRRIVEQQRITSLGELDFASLLRVLDQNWHFIAAAHSFAPSDRNFAKEMFSVRNRWAHVATTGISCDDAFRDFDTLQRFASLVQADNTLINAIITVKDEIRPPSRTTAPHTQTEPSLPAGLEFEVGQLVAPKSDLSLTGAVITILPGQPENRYMVFHDGMTTTYYASQLQAATLPEAAPAWLPLPDFHAHLSAMQICDPSLSTLYSLNAGKIDFVPYQYRPVLKFIGSDRPRLLIADGVGVGKTIEAGLILRELQARADIQSVLIICPKPLVVERKWELEMKRFDERFTHIDGRTLRYCIDEMDLEGEWCEQHSKAIIPYSLFDKTMLHGDASGDRRRRKGLLDLDPPPRFDLVIVDEAHHIRNVDTYTHEGVQFFCNNAHAVLFLTATPLQLGSNDLFVLLNTLRPDLIIDRQSFEHMAAPNRFINRALDLLRSQQDKWQRLAREVLIAAAGTPWGQSFLQNNPEFQRVFDLLGEAAISDEQRVDAINTLEQMHTFSRFVNRTRRRDIGQFTIRRPETVLIAFTPQQRDLHDEILRIQAAILTKLHGDRSVKFLMTTIRRQAASCLFGLVPLLQDILTRRLDELSVVEADDFDDELDEGSLSNIESPIAEVLTKAESLPPDDPKLAALLTIVLDKQKLDNSKVMVFSTFRHTLSYLLEATKREGLRVGMVHGDIPDEERVEIRDRFRLPRDDKDSLDVLLFSEVGCEGLDYEFCDCMVNYDLPWNPMRIEQRIGRIDRRGQKSEYVTIYNMITPGTVDADIYERCLLRIGVFNQEVGTSEEILGEITREIRNIAENLNLTVEERQERLQQLGDNQIRLIRQQQELEEKQHEFFGLRLPELQTRTDIENASSFWLSPRGIQNLITRYLRSVCSEKHEYFLGERPLKTLRLSQEVRDTLLKDFQKLPRQRATSYRQWETWLKGADPHLSITFESACAVDHPKAVLVTPLHPLVRQAALKLKPQHCLMAACTTTDASVPSGEYPFAIYQWQYHGLREDIGLRCVTTSQPISDQLMALLEKGETIDLAETERPAPSVFDGLEEQHYSLWVRARTEHRDRVQQLAGYRRESLSTSHSARLGVLRDQLDRATDEKIQRMRRSQIATAEADYQRRLSELDDAIRRADITTQLVGCGIVIIRSPHASNVHAQVATGHVS